MTVTNHWGKWVDSEIPTTGVLSVNDVAWEWLDYNDEICLDCNNAMEEINNNVDLDEDEKQSELESIECDSNHTKLMGDWVFENDKYWTEDKINGEFSAIVNESTVQVVWSKYLVRGPLCSPCYPGQVDINADSKITDKGFLAYTLPDYLLRKKRK